MIPPHPYIIQNHLLNSPSSPLFSVENKDFFEPDGSQKVCEIIAYHMDGVERDPGSSIRVIAAGLSLAQCAAKAENNKGTYITRHIERHRDIMYRSYHRQAPLGCISTPLIDSSSLHHQNIAFRPIFCSTSDRTSHVT